MVKSVGCGIANPEEWGSLWSAIVKEYEVSKFFEIYSVDGLSRVHGTKSTAWKTLSHERFMVFCFLCVKYIIYDRTVSPLNTVMHSFSWINGFNPRIVARLNSGTFNVVM